MKEIVMAWGVLLPDGTLARKVTDDEAKLFPDLRARREPAEFLLQYHDPRSTVVRVKCTIELVTDSA